MVYKYGLRSWEAFCAGGKVDIHNIVSPDHETVSAYLEHLRSKGFSSQTVAARLGGLRAFFKYLRAEGVIDHDPLAKLGKMTPARGLPKAIPLEDVLRLLDAPDRSTTGLRDRAILETLYGSGMRVSELVALDVLDVDLEERVAHIRHGKGDRGRLVPIGQASKAVAKYLSLARPLLAEEIKPYFGAFERDAMFLNQHGKRLSRASVGAIVRDHAATVGLRVSPHVLRHSCATHMLDNGADIRIVQELLGHDSISSTQVYTLITEERKAQALRLHPRNKVAD